MILLNAFEKDKLQKQYQNTLESLEIGIITKNNSTINYFNSKGISFLSHQAFSKQNEEYETMLKDLKEKIHTFDTDWKVNRKHLELQ